MAGAVQLRRRRLPAVCRALIVLMTVFLVVGVSGVAFARPGKVVAWGLNGRGQCNVPAEAQAGIVDIAAGYKHSLALTRGGKVMAWGGNDYGERDTSVIPEGTIVTAIAAGIHHSLALTGQGEVIAWGDDRYRQCQVPDRAKSDIQAIAAGYWHSLALTEQGEVIAWGYDHYGQCEVPDRAKSGISAIAGGGHQSLAVWGDGEVITWGIHHYGLSAVPDGAKSGVVAIAGGGLHSLAATGSGSAFGWGYSSLGQANIPADARSGASSVAGGWHHSLVLTTDGRVIAWGRNDVHQCDVPEEAESGVFEIVSRYNHNLALVATVQLSVETATVKWTRRQAAVGKVQIRADFDAPVPAPEDVVSVSFDGIELIAAPFSDFNSVGPGEPYVLADGGRLLRLDFAAKSMFVLTPDIVLAELDTSDGVDVELRLGDMVTVENIPMTETGGDRLTYVRTDP